MTEHIILAINPQDAERCGSCKACRSMREFPPMNGTGWRRGPLCLDAARTLREEREAARRVIEAWKVLDESDIVCISQSEYEMGLDAPHREMVAAVAQYEAAIGDSDTISDGFGSTWSAVCPSCGKRTMSVVRPGKVQCSECG